MEKRKHEDEQITVTAIVAAAAAAIFILWSRPSAEKVVISNNKSCVVNMGKMEFPDGINACLNP